VFFDEKSKILHISFVFWPVFAAFGPKRFKSPTSAFFASLLPNPAKP
jgi:hypothetical protein